MGKIKLLLFSVFIFCFGGPVTGFADGTTDTNIKDDRVVLTIDPRILSKMNPEKKKILEDLMESFNKGGIKNLNNYHVSLPSTVFEPLEGQIIEYSSLFRNPYTNSGDEPESLAYDKSGQQKTLAPDQLESIKEEGLFTVASKRFPGQFHVWKINTLLQKGLKNIQISYEEDLSSALGNILIRIPADFVGNKKSWFSAKEGLKNIAYGFRGVLSTIVGLVEERPKYGSYEIETLIEKKKNEFVIAALEKQNNEKKAANKTDDPLFDLRLYDEKLTEKLSTEVARIRRLHEADWASKASTLRKQIKKELEQLYLHAPTKQIYQLVSRKLEDLSFEELNKRLQQDEILESLAPGYGRLISNQNVAVRIAQLVEKNLQDMIVAQEEVIRADLKWKHPILARNDEWMNEQAEALTQSFYQEVRWDHLSLIPLELESRGLQQEAEIYRRIIQFQKESEERVRAELTSERLPANTFEFEKRIWNSDNWIANEVKDYYGNVSYYPQKFVVSKVQTDMPGWRLKIVGNETEAFFKNGLYRVIVSNLWNGPVGLKALFSKSPFYGQKMMDERTGKIVADPNSQTSTFTQNLKDIWQDVATSREEFERTPDRGFLGKRFIRWFNKFWNYGVKGVGGTVAVGVGQPVLTACNFGVSCALAVTAPVWAPISSLFKLGFSATIYDMNTPASRSETVGHPLHQWFPVAQYCLKDIGCAGIGQAVGKTVQGVAYEPLAFTVKGLYANVRSSVRAFYDSFMRNVFLKRGRIPAIDSFAANRIQGPGMASHYFYQIQPEIAVLALQATLESEELRLFESHETEVITKPLKDYYAFFYSILEPIGSINAGSTKEERTLKEEQDQQLKTLREELATRYHKLSLVSEIPTEARNSGIKMLEEDLNLTLTTSEKLVQSFFEEHLKPRMNKYEIERYWQNREMDENDFRSLAQSFYSRLFGDEFLLPLEQTDQKFVIQIKSEGLKDIFKHFPH